MLNLSQVWDGASSQNSDHHCPIRGGIESQSFGAEALKFSLELAHFPLRCVIHPPSTSTFALRGAMVEQESLCGYSAMFQAQAVAVWLQTKIWTASGVPPVQ